MDEKAIKTLKQPFAASQLRTRKGKKGMTFTYVDGALVIERLNDAFGHRWSWAILEWSMKEAPGNCTDVKVQGRLTVRDGEDLVTKDAWGGVLVQPNAMDCEADMLKAASTDALKKAASLFGIGLHLYSDEVDTGDEPAPARRDEPPPRREETRRQPPAQTQQRPPESKAEAPRLTGEQSARIATLASKLGWDDAVVNERATKTYGAKVAALTPEQATNFIKRMELTLEKVKNGKGAA